MKYSLPLAEGFSNKHQPCPITGCWLWTDALKAGGYGRLFVRGRGCVAAHRLSYELHCSAIPQGLSVCHRCDTPSCVNPAHLFLGTATDNMRDMVGKGRSQRGSARPCAKLTEDAVRELRGRKARGERMRLKVEAARLGVSIPTISKIMSGRAWGHIAPAAGGDR